MATRQRASRNVQWDAERHPTGFESSASQAALDILDDLRDESRALACVRDYAFDERPRDKVKNEHFVAALRASEGELALVTWDSMGITSIGYRPDRDQFDVGGYSAVDDHAGLGSEYYEYASRRSVTELLFSNHVDIVLRSEDKQLPGLDESWAEVPNGF